MYLNGRWKARREREAETPVAQIIFGLLKKGKRRWK
jgi:hypothetical protein